MTRLRVIIQARVGSTRFPGKILAPLAGRPMLAHLVERFRAVQSLLHTPREATQSPALEILVATTRETADHVTQAQCDVLGVACFRGPTRDVLARYVAASADMDDNDLILRATADNPLYCPHRTAAMLKRCQEPFSVDYACIRDLSYVVPEIMRVGALRRMAELAKEEYCREHVTPFFRSDRAPFRVRQLPENWLGLRPDIRLTVDTPAEYRRMARIFAELSHGDELIDVEAAYAWCDRQESRPRGQAAPRGLAAWYSDAA